jgi:CO/xanthine dehydrogenase Mo-binding subunit
MSYLTMTGKNTSEVGCAKPRPDARDKVTGHEQFVADMVFPHMLFGAVVRSTRPHAKIRSIHTDTAIALPGVTIILTAKDVPGNNVIPVVFRDQPLLADGIVRYIGEPVALVAAETHEQALRAAAAVEIEYDDLPAVFDPLEARNHPAVNIYNDDNIFKHLQIIKGDADKALTKCDVIIENEYVTPVQEHVYLETQGMIAVPQPASVMQVYGSMQCPFYVREAVAEVLGIPLSNAHIIQTSTGGAFGGKEDVPSLPAAQSALLAYHARRPVKLIYSRDEDIESTSKRHASRIKAIHGATKDGTLLVIKMEYVIDGGAYATLSPIVLFRGVVHAAGPYVCPNIDIQGYAVATNQVPAGAFRGFGSPQVLFAAGRQMDELAKALGMDPVEFLRKNLLREGNRTATGQQLLFSVGAEETLEKAAVCSKWEEKFNREKRQVTTPSGETKYYGIGVSSILYGVGLGAGGEHLARTGAAVSVHEDGSVSFAVGTTEIGQGMKMVLSQIVAETLGTILDAVSMLPTDTTRVPDSGPTVASRATTMSGKAVENACITIRTRMLKAAAGMLEGTSGNLVISNGMLYNDAQETGITFSDIIAECNKRRISLTASGWHHPEHLAYDFETGQGDAYAVYAYATNIAEVAVDAETGQVDVLRIYAAHDVGKAINPQAVEGQIEGGTIQGVGYALYEEIIQKAGRIQNPQFSTYIIPTTADIPEIIPIIVEKPYPGGPYGAKGFGEQPLMGIAPTVVNAICNALDISLNEIPATPERVLQALSSLKDG